MPVGDLGQLCCSIHNWSIRDRWRVEKPLINTSFQNVPIPNKSPSSDQHPGRARTGWQQCQCPYPRHSVNPCCLPSTQTLGLPPPSPDSGARHSPRRMSCDGLVLLCISHPGHCCQNHELIPSVSEGGFWTRPSGVFLTHWGSGWLQSSRRHQPFQQSP